MKNKTLIYILFLSFVIVSYISISKIDFTNENNQEKLIEENSNKKLVALTFDDGPSRYTSELVDILNEKNASATFFIIGKAAPNYSAYLKKAYLAGIEIANHSYTHNNLTEMTIEEIKMEIAQTKKTIEDLEIKYTDLFRPPYGQISKNAIESIDTSFILWSIDTRDWETQDKELIKKEVELKIKDGSIILFHDSYKSTNDAVKEILEMYSDEYEFVTVTELFRRKNKKIENNKVYYSVDN